MVTAAITTSVANGILTITDTSDYGVLTTPRSDVYVVFTVQRVTSETTTDVVLPAYSQLSVVTLLVDISDGYYLVKMEIKLKSDGSVVSEIEANEFVYTGLESCKEAAAEMLTSCCDDVDVKLENKYIKLLAAVTGIEAFIAEDRFADASDLLACAAPLCQNNC